MDQSLFVNLHGIIAILVLIVVPVGIITLFAKSPLSKGLSLVITILAHIQLLLGLYLYFFGTNGMALFKTGEAMSNSQFRFYAVEHIFTMIIAIVLFTIARSKIKKSSGSGSLRSPLILYVVGFVLLLSRVPWERWPFFQF